MNDQRSQASEDAQVFVAIGRAIAEANSLFFGPFPALPANGYDRDQWERRVAELEKARDILWQRHAAR